ncbi:unnamed protein product [Meganyctiphanes norvegica]|uniref:PID domain-containing protein n=1 Tax=Meganyctiphanes norvegica TaxID=48144 RepID=A0AAV2QY54_MEGNR
MRQLQQDTDLPQLPPKMKGSTKAPQAADDITKEVRKLSIDDKNNQGGAKTPQQTADAQAPQPVFQLPQEFVVKYLGKREAGGLWGIKHTRKPVDDMVSQAKEMKPGEQLPYLKMTISDKGVNISEMPQNVNKNFEGGFYSIDVISYGVQDLVYTRVFAMILVSEDASFKNYHPFLCHAFVCDSRHNARRLTFSLAQAFQKFSKEVKGSKQKKPKKFAIDLRSPEEIEADLKEADSEA